jgi:alpha-L-fucosidase
MSKRETLLTVVAGVILLGAATGVAQAQGGPGAVLAADPATIPAVTDPKTLVLSPADMQWWLDAKFGMFIHWGLYAIPAQGEWYMNNKKVPADEYRKLMEEFNPQHYDPAVWAKAAKDAGMKYMVFVARHHDGFAMWDSPSSWRQFDAMHAAAKRDLVAPYVKAVRDAGMRVGLYYSPMDWRMPGYFDPKGQPENAAELKKQAWGQVSELLTKYGKVDVLWYDGGWMSMRGSDADAEPFWESNKLAKYARSVNSKLIISQRSGWMGDFDTVEGSAPVTGPIRTRPWEKCLNLNDVSWGYNTEQKVMTRDQVVTMLVNTVVRGGNMLLNVGPDKDGVVPEAHIARLKEVGDWLTRYGDSIYGTRPGPFPPVDRQYGATCRGKTVYVHILSWAPVPAPARRGRGAPAETPAPTPTPTVATAHPDTLVLPALKQKIAGVRLLTGDGTVTFTQSDSNVSLKLPVEKHDALDTIIALECETNVEP